MESEAYWEGKLANWLGQTRDSNPHPKRKPAQRSRWFQGWDAGELELSQGMLMLARRMFRQCPIQLKPSILRRRLETTR